MTIELKLYSTNRVKSLKTTKENRQMDCIKTMLYGKYERDIYSKTGFSLLLKMHETN